MFNKIVILVVMLAIDQGLACTFETNQADYVCNLVRIVIQIESQLLTLGGPHLPGFTDDHVTSLITSSGSLVRIFPSLLIDRFVNLRQVIVENATMATFPSQINRCTSLETIAIGFNDLTVIPNGIFQNCAGLLSISMTNNLINQISENAFAGLTNLQTLILSNNVLQTLPQTVFAGVPNLRALFLSSNLLNQFVQATFSSLSILSHLALDDNSVSSWDGSLLQNNSMLTILNLERNQILGLNAQSFRNLKALTTLTLNGNQLQALPIFDDLPGLITMTLDDNQLITISGESFQNMPQLRQLHVKRNRITNVDFINARGRSPSPIRILSLRQNQIVTLQDFAFSMFSNLEQLDLASNQIKRLNSFSVWPIRQMRRLDVTNNLISRIEREMLQTASSLTFLVGGNICFDDDITILNPTDFESRVVPMLRDCFGSAGNKNASLVVVIAAIFITFLSKM